MGIDIGDVSVRSAIAICMALSLSACGPSDNGVVNTAGTPATETFLAPVHDPALIHDGNAYYLFATGQSDNHQLSAWRSPDGTQWEELPSPIQAQPWARTYVPAATIYWAPDIVQAGDGYRLYYSVSTFGSNQSAIGMAMSKSMNPASPDYGWRDMGLVYQSSVSDNFNAIDPNVFIDEHGRHWLSFGSFWSGLKLIELDGETGKPATGVALHALAQRPDVPDHAIEAPFIFARDGYYYLMASIGHCCRGVRSDYKIIIGRSRAVTGPYLDKDGTPMLSGGGTIIAEAKDGDQFKGPGHPAHLRRSGGQDFIVFHAYDTRQNGRPTFQMGAMIWTEGWPTIQMRMQLP